MIISTDGINVAVAVFEAGMTAIAAGCAIWVALRDGRWRKNGLAAQLSSRIDAAQLAADRWHETEPAKVLKAEVDRHGEMLVTHDAKLTNVATKEDLARVEGAARAAAQSSRDAAAGVDRIEGILLKKALQS